MKHFFIPMLDSQTDWEFLYTEGHKREYALKRFFNPDYVFVKDSLPFHTYSDIPQHKASVKSPNATLFVNGKVITEETSVADAVEYYITNCVSEKYYIVVKPKKWADLPPNSYMVLEMNKKEMRKMLLLYACTDRDSKGHKKNCLRLKRTDDVIAKYYRMERI